MLKRKTAHKVLFASMLLLFLLAMRMLLMAKSGIALVGLVVACSIAWAAFRLVERFVIFVWGVSGVVADQLFQETAAVRVAEEQWRGK
jgi:hypothetical protein